MGTLAIELPTTKADRQKAADLAFAAIEKDHGKGSVFVLGRKNYTSMPHVPTGLFSLDNNVLGIGGFPKGRIIEIYGPESSGKTTLCLRSVAAAQLAGGLAAYVDPENAMDPLWAAANGVDTSNLMVSQPDTGEEALEIVEKLVVSGAFAIIVVDSVSALVPKAELEGDFGDACMGLQARLMSKAMRMLTSKVRKSQTVLCFINQIREKIGVMFGSPEVTSGGRALKFFASVRLDVRKIGLLGEKDKPYGNRVRIKTTKNKVSTPYRSTEVDLLYTGERMGFNVEGDLLDCAAIAGVVEKAGSWFSYQGEKLGQGRDGAIEGLIAAGKFEEIRKALVAKIQIQKDTDV